MATLLGFTPEANLAREVPPMDDVSGRRARNIVSYKEPDESEFERPGKRPRASAADEETSSRKSSRQTTKPSPFDALFCTDAKVPGAPEYTYSIGGAECGGSEAERVLRGVEIDETAINLTQQFSEGRRVVLYRGRHAVAAAVAEMHATGSILELPIVASARSHRQQGNGSILVALLSELAARELNASILVVSATPESKRFWLGQGLHAPGHCPPRIAAALRALAQTGARLGFFETTQMARQLEPCDKPGELIAAAFARAAATAPRGLLSSRAGETIGYEDLPAGTPSFVTDATGKRVPLDSSAEGRIVHVPPSRLQAFPREAAALRASAWGEAGWGLRCSVPISKGQVVLEVCGEMIDEATHEVRCTRWFTTLGVHHPWAHHLGPPLWPASVPASVPISVPHSVPPSASASVGLLRPPLACFGLLWLPTALCLPPLWPLPHGRLPLTTRPPVHATNGCAVAIEQALHVPTRGTSKKVRPQPAAHVPRPRCRCRDGGQTPSPTACWQASYLLHPPSLTHPLTYSLTQLTVGLMTGGPRAAAQQYASLLSPPRSSLSALSLALAVESFCGQPARLLG